MSIDAEHIGTIIKAVEYGARTLEPVGGDWAHDCKTAARILREAHAHGFITDDGKIRASLNRSVAGTTADGVQVRVGDCVYRATPSRMDVGYAQMGGDVGGDDWWANDIGRFYSTREAALAAMEKNK